MRTLPTEPIGSIPRTAKLLETLKAHGAGQASDAMLADAYQVAIRDTIECLEATGSPVISDGEQKKYHNFATYAVHGSTNFAPDGFKLQFVNHSRQWPRLVSGPFRYECAADSFLDVSLPLAKVPLKQAVISPSALSLFYPPEPIEGYSREQYIEDLLQEHVTEVRACLCKGAHSVQVDFTEGRLAFKLDPSGHLLANFVQLNNLALSHFSEEERSRIGVHTCPGGDLDSTHSFDVDYAELLPSLFELKAGKFFISLARETNRLRVLELIRNYLKPDQVAFVGVIDVLDPRIETPEEVRDRVLEAAQYIPLDQLGTTDDCGYCPFCDDVSTSRETAFAKIKARVEGTRLASQVLFSC